MRRKPLLRCTTPSACCVGTPTSRLSGPLSFTTSGWRSALGRWEEAESTLDELMESIAAHESVGDGQEHHVELVLALIDARRPADAIVGRLPAGPWRDGCAAAAAGNSCVRQTSSTRQGSSRSRPSSGSARRGSSWPRAGSSRRQSSSSERAPSGVVWARLRSFARLIPSSLPRAEAAGRASLRSGDRRALARVGTEEPRSRGALPRTGTVLRAATSWARLRSPS